MGDSNAFMNTFIRGGRLRKVRRGIVSFAPFVACTSVVALGAVIAASMPAEAGRCPGSGGVFHCSGTTTNESTQSLTAVSGEALTVTSGGSFGIHVSSGSAIVVANVTGSTSIDFRIRGNDDIQAADAGIEVNHQGTGDAYFEVDQDMRSGEDGFRAETAASSGALTVKVRNVDATQDTSFLEADGLDIVHNGRGNLVVETESEVKADARGVHASHQGTGSVTVTADRKVTSGSQSTAAGNNKHAIVVDAGASTTTATVTAYSDLVANRGGDGILITHAGSGKVEVIAEGSIMATGGSGSDFGDGVEVANTGGGNVRITAKAITADARGIRASHQGTGGSVSVIAQGAIVSGSGSSVGENRHAIVVDTSAGVTTATIEATGNLTANRGGDGIALTHAGSGNVKVTATGTITATGSDGNFLGEGISVDQTNTGAGIETYIKADGQITSHSRGIAASHSGGGKLTVMAAGITSNNAEGIHVATRANAGSVEITASGAIMSEKDGINVDHQGTGDVSITVNNNITTTGTAANCSTTPANCERGIDVGTAASSAGVSVAAMGQIQTHDHSIYIDHQGNGMASVTTGANSVLFSSAGEGIVLKTTSAVAGVTAVLNGRIGVSSGGAVTRTKRSGARIYNNGAGALDIDVTGDIYSETTALYAHSDGSILDIYINSRVDGATRGVAISNETTNGAATDRVVIRLGDDAVVSGFVGMALQNSKTSSETVVYLGGSVISTDSQGSSPTAITFSASGDATRRVVIEAGRKPVITGSINSFRNNAAAIVELTGAGSDTFNIGTDLEPFVGFNQLRKTGGGTWTFTGTHAAGKVFEQVDINEGKFVWDSENPLRSTSVAVADNALLEVTRATSWSSNLTLSGRLAITGAGSGLELGTLTGSGGQIDIDVDFSGGDADLDSPKLLLSSVEGDPISVNIRAMGGFSEGGGDGTITLGNLIQVTGSADADAFTVGGALDGGFSFQLVHDDSSGMNRWALVASEGGAGAGTDTDVVAIAGSIEQALYESLPAALTQLASLESHRQRLQGRLHGDDGGVWARVSGASVEFEPLATTLATYEIKDSVAEFGVDVPLHTEHVGDFTLGASVAFGSAAAKVAVSGSTGEIETGSFKAAVSANWEYDGSYVDGQLQYATFNNDIKADAKLGSTSATAYSGGLEVGYGMDLGGLRVAPSARLLWASVDFEDFTDSAGTEIVLDDGVVVTGRAGIGVEYDWNGALIEGISSADVLLRGRAGVLVPVDGDVNTRVGGTEFISKREDPAFDVGISATYAWDAYSLHADFSTLQGGEVEGYSGKIGFKHEF